MSGLEKEILSRFKVSDQIGAQLNRFDVQTAVSRQQSCLIINGSSMNTEQRKTRNLDAFCNQEISTKNVTENKPKKTAKQPKRV